MAVVLQRDLTGARWSSAVSCPRRAVYEHQDAPKEPPSDQTKRWWRRGHAVAAAIRGALIADLREQNRRPRAEEVIPWPASDPVGEGHADLYIPHERVILEVTSTSGCDLDQHKALQAAGYALEHPNAEHAQVVSVDPSSFEERWYPINVAALEPQVRSIQEQVVHGVKTGELPERVCRHPHDAPAFLCPFVEHCFAGWTRPDPDVLLLDEEAVVLAELEDDVGRHKQALKAAEIARNEMRDELRPYLDAGAEVETTRIAKLKRTVIDPRRTLSLSDMQKAGVSLPAELEPYVKTGQSSERWTVKRRES